MNDFFDFLGVKLQLDDVSGRDKGAFYLQGVGPYRHSSGEVRLRKIRVKYIPDFNKPELHLKHFAGSTGNATVKPMDEITLSLERQIRDHANGLGIDLPKGTKTQIAGFLTSLMCEGSNEASRSAIPKEFVEKIAAKCNDAWTDGIALKFAQKNNEPYHAVSGFGQFWYYDLGEVKESDYPSYSFTKTHWK